MVQRELPGNMALEVGYEGNHQAHQVILWNSDPYPNLGTSNTAISSASLQEIQPACSTCQSVGNGLSMTSSFGFGNYAAGSAKLEKRFTHGPAVPDVLRLEPRTGEQRHTAERLEQPRIPNPDQLGFGLFQRFVGHPA